MNEWGGAAGGEAWEVNSRVHFHCWQAAGAGRPITIIIIDIFEVA